MQNQVKPVVEVVNFWKTKNPLMFSVEFQKTISSKTIETSKFSLASRLKGIEGIIQNQDKKLVVFANFSSQAIEEMGLEIGVDVNTLFTDTVVDIIEKYDHELTLNNGLDATGNVTKEPIVMSNDKPNVLLYDIQTEKGIQQKCMFRSTELVDAATIEELPKSDEKLKYSSICEMVFDGVKKQIIEGKNRVTPEYQSFLNTIYAEYNLNAVTVLKESVTA